MDAGQQNDASHIALAAAAFTKQHVPFLYKQVFQLMVMIYIIYILQYICDATYSTKYIDNGVLV